MFNAWSLFSYDFYSLFVLLQLFRVQYIQPISVWYTLFRVLLLHIDNYLFKQKEEYQNRKVLWNSIIGGEFLKGWMESLRAYLYDYWK